MYAGNKSNVILDGNACVVGLISEKRHDRVLDVL